MKRFVSILSLLALAGGPSALATQSLFENDAPVLAPPDIAPQVDATAFVNRSAFSVSSSLYLYDFANCLNFTNTGSGTMFASPGFRFDFVTNSIRLAADNFVNRGEISVGTVLLVFATNIISSGDLLTSAGGIIKLHGSNLVDIERTGLRSGSDDTSLISSGIYIGNTFYNDAGVNDVYWGEGLNNTLNNANRPMPLISLDGLSFSQPNFGVPYASSPYHQVFVRNSTGTNSAVVPGGVFRL